MSGTARWMSNLISTFRSSLWTHHHLGLDLRIIMYGNNNNNNNNNNMGGGGNSVPKVPRFNVDGAPDDTISCLRFSPGNCPITVLGCTSWDGTVRAWQVNNNGNNIQTSPLGLTNGNAPQLSLSVGADGKVAHGGVCRKVMLWDLQSGASQQVGSHDLAVSSVQYCTDNVPQPLVMSGSWDGTVKIWDSRQPTGNPIKTENFGMPVFDIDAQGSAPLATICLGRKVVVYNLSNLSIVKDHNVSSIIKFGNRCIRNCPDQTAFVVGSHEGRLGHHDIKGPNATTTSALPAVVFKAHNIEHSSTKFTMFQTNFCAYLKPMRGRVPDWLLVSGGGDGFMRIWRPSSKSRVAEVDPVMSIANPTEALPISAGDVSADMSMVAVGHSYDWAMGKENFNPTMEKLVTIVPFQESWAAPV